MEETITKGHALSRPGPALPEETSVRRPSPGTVCRCPWRHTHVPWVHVLVRPWEGAIWHPMPVRVFMDMQWSTPDSTQFSGWEGQAHTDTLPR
jgi:hypothetical protein